jgi:lactate dehydrogenase-like 2-hydroxyacid dehydrogenase
MAGQARRELEPALRHIHHFDHLILWVNEGRGHACVRAQQLFQVFASGSLKTAGVDAVEETRNRVELAEARLAVAKRPA